MSAVVASSMKIQNEVQQQQQQQAQQPQTQTASLSNNSDAARASDSSSEKTINDRRMPLGADANSTPAAQAEPDTKNKTGVGGQKNNEGTEEKNSNTSENKPKDVNNAPAQDGSSAAKAVEAPSTDGQVLTGRQQKEKAAAEINTSCLPGALFRILFEVATTGESSTLTWNTARKGSELFHENAAVTKKRGLSAGSSSSKLAAAARSQFVSGGSNHSNNSANAKVAASPPPRKKLRNGLHNSAHRKSAARAHSSRKRPLHMIRTSGTSTTTTTMVASIPSPGVAAAAAATSRLAASTTTSGSEPEDTSQYDSEGTSMSTTSTSEVSVDQQHWHMRPRSLNLRVMGGAASALRNTTRAGGSAAPPSSLREAFQVAVGLVLEDWFQHKGGYKLSPAESKIHGGRALSAKDIFAMRKDRLLKRLEGSAFSSEFGDDGPFTIQRIAEVLVAPEKYYTQTHKLCNCLEKLLLVSSPITAFGGSRGGVTSQSRIEEQELAALADERDRIQSEFRQMRRRRSSLARTCSASSEAVVGCNDAASELALATATVASEGVVGSVSSGEKRDNQARDAAANSEVGKVVNPDDAEREQLEAAARASLRNKFDHVGIDPHHHHHGAVGNTNAKAIAESRSLTNSPPPPSLNAPNLSGGVLRSPHATHGEHPNSPVRSPSPILFDDVAGSSPPTPPATGAGAVPNPNPNMHLLQMHHAAAVAGVSPFDLMTLGTSAAAAGNVPAAGGALLGPTQLNGMRDLDVDCRSSASSDVDSESDDVSFDDSASDRSDGSDSGFVVGASASAAEGAASSTRSAVARAMALKRQQTRQQQQRSQKAVASTDAGTTPESGASTGTPAVAASAPEEGDVSDSSGDMAD